MTMYDDTIHLTTDSTQEEIEKWLVQMKKKNEQITTLMNYHSKSIKQLKQKEVEFEIEIQKAKKNIKFDIWCKCGCTFL